MKADIDSLLQAEKQAADAVRHRQQMIGRVFALFLFCTIIVGLAIAFFIVQKDLSKQDFYTFVIYALVMGAIGGVIEYIKIRIKGKKRSLVFEAIHFLVFVISMFILAQLWKTT